MTTGSIFWFVFFAASGGVLVLIGLLMERLSEKDPYKNLSDFRRCKSRKVWGEWWVMAGIVVEIAVGIFSAIDAWETNPLNRPIVSATAVVTLLIGETNEVVPSGLPATVIFRDKFGTPPTSGWDIKQVVFELGVDKNAKSLKNIPCGNLQHTDSLIKNGHTVYVVSLSFDMNSTQRLSFDSVTRQVFPPGTAFPAEFNFSVKHFDKGGFAAFMTPALPDGFEIKSGTCVLMLNGLKMSFSVPEHSNGGLKELIKAQTPENND
jgi:hypothetical protein